MFTDYQARWLAKDLGAGAVLAALLVPAGMAYAEASGLPAVHGRRKRSFQVPGRQGGPAVEADQESIAVGSKKSFVKPVPPPADVRN